MSWSGQGKLPHQLPQLAAHVATKAVSLAKPACHFVRALPSQRIVGVQRQFLLPRSDKVSRDNCSWYDTNNTNNTNNTYIR